MIALGLAVVVVFALLALRLWFRSERERKANNRELLRTLAVHQIKWGHKKVLQR